MGTKHAVRRPLDKLQLKAKVRQAAKLAEIQDALTSAGYHTATNQAAALGIGRSTAWAFFNGNKRAGPSSIVIKRILASPSLPPKARRKVNEYVEEKIAGLYGHSEPRRRWLRDQFWAPRKREEKYVSEPRSPS
jgi:hypothetical protein